MTTSANRVTTALGTALFIATAGVATPSWPGTATDKYLSGQGAQFESLAGSRENLESLAGGLRTGTRVTLTEPTSAGVRVTAFDPPTKPMGYGNITRTLNLANRQLASVGITDPTAAELRAALNGGTVTTPNGSTQLPGVLKLRSEHMGWGKIAHTIGVPPGNQASKAVASRGAPHVAPRGGGGTITNASGAAVSSPSHVQGNGRSGIVSAAGSSHVPSLGHGNALGRNPMSTAAGIQGGIGHGGGNAHGHGRSGK